jgi:hypothetical protein
MAQELDIPNRLSSKTIIPMGSRWMKKHHLKNEFQRIEFTSNIYMETVWPIPVIPAHEIPHSLLVVLRIQEYMELQKKKEYSFLL